MDYRKMNKAIKKDHFSYHLLIRYWIGWLVRSIIASWIGILAIIK